MLKYRLLSKHTKMVASVRFCYKEKKEVSNFGSMEKTDAEYTPLPRGASFGGVQVKVWNERAAIKKQVRDNKPLRKVNNVVDFLRTVQNVTNFPKTITEFLYHFKKKLVEKELVQQEFLPKREAILKPDLAAAHFIVGRGGSVKFLGKPEWVGVREAIKTLPSAYVPGLFIDSIKAEGTSLYYEGLQNIRRLKYLSYLSLKNLETMNDWGLDWISKEYSLTLKHLDISGCKNITYRSLSSFYKFECLETLNVEGISDAPEFKLACLMLLEIMPNLEIKGIDLTVPKEISLNETENQSIPVSEKVIEEAEQIPDSKKRIEGAQ